MGLQLLNIRTLLAIEKMVRPFSPVLTDSATSHYQSVMYIIYKI